MNVSVDIKSDLVTFRWDAPTLNDDGSSLALADIAGYRLSWRRFGEEINAGVSVVPTCTTAIRFSQAGTYFVRIVTLLRDGRESSPKDEIKIEVAA